MRKLSDHKVGGLNEDLEVYARDEPGDGGACHKYQISYDLNPGTDAGGVNHHGCIKFQNGTIKEKGVNGITNEVLMSIVIDRLRGFQSGEFACRENALALTNMEQALMWLQHRTRERLARGVEGTHKK